MQISENKISANSKKSIAKIKRILNIALFTTAVVSFVLILSLHPFLHNHAIDDKCHSDCPACVFLVTASFFILPSVVILMVFHKIAYQIFFKINPYLQTKFLQKKFARGPPISSPI